jgi:hypothetical protein
MQYHRWKHLLWRDTGRESHFFLRYLLCAANSGDCYFAGTHRFAAKCQWLLSFKMRFLVEMVTACTVKLLHQCVRRFEIFIRFLMVYAFTIFCLQLFSLVLVMMVCCYVFCSGMRAIMLSPGYCCKCLSVVWNYVPNADHFSSELSPDVARTYSLFYYISFVLASIAQLPVPAVTLTLFNSGIEK